MLIGLLSFFSIMALANDELYVHLKNIAPHVSNSKAKELSKLIFKSSQSKNINPFVFAAILKVESDFQLHLVNSTTNDYGISQVNEYNIKSYGFCKEKLITDMQYSVDAGAKVFSWFNKKYGIKNAIKRYNCGTKKRCIAYTKSNEYFEKVKKYIPDSHKYILE